MIVTPDGGSVVFHKTQTTKATKYREGEELKDFLRAPSRPSWFIWTLLRLGISKPERLLAASSSPSVIQEKPRVKQQAGAIGENSVVAPVGDPVPLPAREISRLEV